MKTLTKELHINDFTQASFPPFTRGYEALPKKLFFDTTIDKSTLEVIHQFSIDEIVHLVKQIEHMKKINLLVTTEILTVEFIAGIRALRTLLAIIDTKNESANTRKINFFIEVYTTTETAQELIYAQLAQIDTILCSKEDLNNLQLLSKHLTTPPIDMLFGHQELEEKTAYFVKQVYNHLPV